MTKNCNKIKRYVVPISYRISPQLEAEILPLLLPNQRLSAYARSVIDPDRILEIKNKEKSLRIAAILKANEVEFDTLIKALRNTKYMSLSLGEGVGIFEDFLHFLDKLTHQICLMEADLCEEKKTKKPAKSKTFLINEEGNKTVRVDFRIGKELYAQLKEKAVGEESVNQLCRAMLLPNRYIQPTDPTIHNILMQANTFYCSRLQSILAMINDVLDFDFKCHIDPTVIYAIERANELDSLISNALGVSIYKRNKNEKKAC